MSKTISMVVASILLATGVLAVHGVAHATDVHGAVALGRVDIWQLECTSSATFCITADVCDAVSSSADDWMITLDVYSPTSLLGKADTAFFQTQTAQCGAAEVCRVAPSHGPMKAFVNINHPGGASDSDTYNLTGHCFDSLLNLLPASSTKLTIKSNE